MNVNNYESNKNPFRFYNNEFQRRSFIKTYQHDIEDQKNELLINE